MSISDQQYSFMQRKHTIDAIFTLRLLIERYREGQKELHYVLVDLETAGDRKGNCGAYWRSQYWQRIM